MDYISPLQEDDVDMLKSTKSIGYGYGNNFLLDDVTFGSDMFDSVDQVVTVPGMSHSSEDFQVPTFAPSPVKNTGNCVEFGLGDDIDTMLVDHSTDVDLDVSYLNNHEAAAPKFAEETMHIKTEPVTPNKSDSIIGQETATAIHVSSLVDDNDHMIDMSEDMDDVFGPATPITNNMSDTTSSSSPSMSIMITPPATPAEATPFHNSSLTSRMSTRARRPLLAPRTRCDSDEDSDAVRSQVSAARARSSRRRAARARMSAGVRGTRGDGGAMSVASKSRSRKIRTATVNMDDLKLPGISMKDATTIGRMFPGNVLQLDRDGFKEWRQENKLRKLTSTEDDALRRIRRRLLGRTYAKRSRERQVESENAALGEVKELEKENRALRASIESMERRVKHLLKRK